MTNGGDTSQGSGGSSGGGRRRRRGGGSSGGSGSGGAPRGGTGRPAKGSAGRRGSGGRSAPAGGQQQPLEIAVRSSRNAIRRHAETLRDEQSRLACRSLLVALHGNLGVLENPAEVLVSLEQVQRALHVTARREDAQLPVAIRAVVAFAMETPARQRDAQELVRLLLRHVYVLAADYMPRHSRDDGRFRASAILDVVDQVAREYLSDADFERLRR